MLGDPIGIGLDGSQHLWVFCRGERGWTEPFPHEPIMAATVLMLDRKSGRLIKGWGAGRFIMPHGLTVDHHDRIWLTDSGLHQVLCFTADGELLLQLGEACMPGNDSACGSRRSLRWPKSMRLRRAISKSLRVSSWRRASLVAFSSSRRG